VNIWKYILIVFRLLFTFGLFIFSLLFTKCINMNVVYFETNIDELIYILAYVEVKIITKYYLTLLIIKLLVLISNFLLIKKYIFLQSVHIILFISPVYIT